MAIKVSKWTRTNRGSIPTTCYYWLQGRCNRNPCRFLHREPLLRPSTVSHSVGNTVSCNARKRCSSSDSENSLPKRKLKATVWNRNSGDSIGKIEEVVEAYQSSSPTVSTQVVEVDQSPSPTLSTKVVEIAESS
ncbi:unnamed protein product [Trifolium pratense]|uniref:Uncharacterized protein n=1 Tax=Trifolium pratense TaxID=57577 RepID=A0ACB0KMP0_TRIPR|nr:unnamed protein product [Trifolium pratense]